MNNCINSIEVDSEVVDLCFHPNKDLIALAHIDGQIDLFSYAVGADCLKEGNFNYHKKACRTVAFNPQGEWLISSSADKSIFIFDIQTSLKVNHLKSAHDCPIYSLLVIDDNIIASGDDDGFLKVWDFRKEGAIMAIQENDDCLTDMLIDDTKRELLVTSGEGTLTSFDIRKHNMKVQSELFDSGLNSIARVMENSKIVCGSEDGVLTFFNWSEWGNMSDRFPGHTLSIEAIIPLSDNIVCTADSDGVRLVHLFPNRFIGIIGSHDDQPVENLSLSRCCKWVASCSHDQHVRFWDVSNAAHNIIDAKSRANKADKKRVINSNRPGSSSNFFDDLIEADANSVSNKKKKIDNSDDGDGSGGPKAINLSDDKHLNQKNIKCSELMPDNAEDSDLDDDSNDDDDKHSNDESEGADNECDDNISYEKIIKKPSKKIEKRSQIVHDTDDDDDDDVSDDDEKDDEDNE